MIPVDLLDVPLAFIKNPTATAALGLVLVGARTRRTILLSREIKSLEKRVKALENPPIMPHGIDISHYQGVVDFDFLSRNTTFLFIRSSYGAPDPGEPASKYQDLQFKRNQAEARRVGIRRGYYHFCYPALNSPEAEVKQFLDTVGPLQEGEMLALDFEVWAKDPPAWCGEFLDRVQQQTGVKPFIYMNFNATATHDWRAVSATYPLWLAQWNDRPDLPPLSLPWPAGIPVRQYGLDRTFTAHETDGDVSYTDLAPYGLQPVRIVGASTAPKYPRVKILYPVRIRTAPSLGARIIRLMAVGEPLDYAEPVLGDIYNGYGIWLRKPDNLYVWAGATTYKQLVT